MDKMVVFGGTGGIGCEIQGYFSDEYNIVSLGSKDVNIVDLRALEKFFKEHNDTKIILNMSGCNSNAVAHKMSEEEISRQVNINIIGNINLVRASLSYMRENKFGRIILASSVLAKKTVAGTSVYSGCKSFIETFVRVVATENAKKGITINALRMGYMDAGLTYTIPRDILNEIRKSIPAGCFGSIGDLATLIDCIINTPYINGTSIDINGGLNG